MDRDRAADDENAQINPPSVSKRRCPFDNDSEKTFLAEQTDSPAYGHYTVAWICALHIELAAARAMLDETHESLPAHINDSNTYTLGSVENHNVVIACLPAAEYGTNNAASVLTNLVRTFPSIKLGLMVGIGGGVPGASDIRLGDVVVGTRVMQYDLDKIVGDGRIQHTAVSRVPQHLFGTAVSTLRSKHELEPSCIPFILRQKVDAKGLAEYARPNAPDQLFNSTYDHTIVAADCERCDASQLVPRRIRTNENPEIHYGAIASSNQVMRSGIVRDDTARRLDVICFEMEAAGLMGIMPCLPIRGICDYADSHKNKKWQRYAATTAAAYARELLSVMPRAAANTAIKSTLNPHKRVAYLSGSTFGSARSDIAMDNGSMYSVNKSGTSYSDPPNERRQRLLESLKFDQIDARKLTIKSAHNKTCKWFLNHPDYHAWLDSTEVKKHHGFLWISGMYRSLLYQLLQQYPDIQAVFDDADLFENDKDECPSLSITRELFHNAVSLLGSRSLTCFVDALDECDEQQILDMIQYFEDLMEDFQVSENLKICFSSRHYPYITIRWGTRLVLEDLPGHLEDMEKYIQSRLRISDAALMEELRSYLLEKAAGVFLWVVLVVEILNKEEKRGRLAMKKRLAEIPSGLSELFKDILTRDSENMEDLLISILWILYSKRPLQPKEFYHAIWSGLSAKGLADPEIPNIDAQENGDYITKCVISSSKGLAEITKSKRQPTVQFIHESVRDFLLKDKGLHELWPELGFDWEYPGHERLKNYCHVYLDDPLLREALQNDQYQEGVPSRYPFLEYASHHILYHADIAAVAISQRQFLLDFPVEYWITLLNRFEAYESRRYVPHPNILYLLADKGLPNLIRTRLKEDPEINIRGGRYKYPLFAALANGNKEAAGALLGLTSSMYNGVDVAHGFKHKKDLKGYVSRTPLSWSAQEGRAEILELLIKRGADVNELDGERKLPLDRAIETNNPATGITLLLHEDCSSPNGRGRARILFFKVIRKGWESACRILIEKGVKVNAPEIDGSTPLHIAVIEGKKEIAELLVENGADINAQNSEKQTPLHLAVIKGKKEIAKLLLENGANINAQNSEKQTPLYVGLEFCQSQVADFLLKNGANPHTQDVQKQTPLHAAAVSGSTAIVELLERGVNVNAQNSEGETALHLLSDRTSISIIDRIIAKGADINIPNHANETPLDKALSYPKRVLALNLVKKGAYVDRLRHSVDSLLIEAVSMGDKDGTRSVLGKGANVDSKDSVNNTPLHIASGKNYEEITRLLVDHGADINASGNDCWSPLFMAAYFGHEAILKFLIGAGADVNKADIDGNTPLHVVSRLDTEGAAKLLIEKGADANRANNDGDTPLHFASQRNTQGIAKLLIDQGADVNTRGVSGCSALHMATYSGHKAIVRLLIDHGADANIRNEYGQAPHDVARVRGHLAIAEMIKNALELD